MNELVAYITGHCIRGACTCGKCIDAPAKKFQPNGHTADVQFFKVALKDNPTNDEKEMMKNKLLSLIRQHEGEFCELDLLSGDEYNYLQVGGWIGDQGLALMLMGMGDILGIWKLTTPNKVAPEFSDETKKMLAEAGYISIISKNGI